MNKVEIQLNTTATGNGVEATIAELDRLTKKAGEITAKVKLPGADPKTPVEIKQTTAELEREAVAADKAAKELHEVAAAERAVHQEADTGRAARRDVTTWLAQTEDHAQVTKIAFYDLDKAMTATGSTTQSLVNKTGGLAKPTRDNATALLMFSQGLEDAQYGIRGVLNNIPGLVMALGGKAGLAGALSIAGVGIAALVTHFATAKKEAEDFEVDLEQIADNYANRLVEKLEAADRARRLANERLAIADIPDTAGRDAEQKAFDARQENIATLIEVTRTLNELMGRQVAAQEVIAAAEKERAREREEQQAREIEMEKQKATAAKAAVAEAEKKRTEEAEALGDTIRDVVAQRERLALLQAQRDVLVEAAKALPPMQPGGNPVLHEAAFQAAEPGRRAAARDLEAFDKANSSEMKALDRSVLALEERIDQLGEVYERAQIKVEAATQAADRQNAATQENIETILKEGQVKQAADTMKTASEADAALAVQIREAIDIVKGSSAELTRSQKEAIPELESILADGHVNLTEMSRVITALSQLLNGNQKEIGQLGAAVQQALALANQNSARLLQIDVLMGQSQSLLSPAPPRNR